MDLVMTQHRHPIVNHPRVWQPWYIAGEGDKATVHPVDFSSSIHSSGLNCPYDQLSGTRGLRLKRRPERKPSEVSKRCLTEKLQHVERSVDSKENVSSYDYLSDTDSEDQLSDEDTGKLVVDDNADDEIIENNDSNGITKSPLSSSGHFHPTVESVGDADEDSRGGVRMKAKDALRLVVEPRRGERDEEQDEEEVGSRNDNPAVDEDTTLEDEDSQMGGREEEEQEGPLDMTTNNRSRNGIGGNPPRWSPSTTPSSPVNLSSIYYPHPPRYSPYVSTAPPPPPYHALALPQHNLSSRPHSASPPPYLPPYQVSSNHFGDSNGHRSAPLRPAHTVQQHRPSVITCANITSGRGSPPPPPLPSHHPPHHHSQHHHKSQSLALNHHRNCLPNAGPNDLSSSNSGLGMINRRTLSDPTAGRMNNSGSGNGGGSLYKSRRSSDHGRVGHRRELLSGGMCDPVIDEHFRRSLGKDYPEYLSSSVSNKTSQNNYKSLPTVGSANSCPSANSSSTSSVSITGMSVDDHFAKALGETWLRLQSKGIPSSSSSPASPSVTTGSSPSSKPSSPTISLGSGYVSNSMSPKSVSPSPAVQQRQSIVST